jgi:hypothetical protein
MEQSSSWEANRLSGILWSPKVHHRVYKTRHLSLSWARSIQSMPPTHFLKIHLNIILPSTSGSSRYSFPQVSPPTLYSSILNHNHCHITRYIVQSWPLYQKCVATVQPDRKIHINCNFVWGSDATWIGLLPTFKRKILFIYSRSKYVGWDYTLILRTSNIIMEAGSPETSEADHTSTQVPDPQIGSTLAMNDFQLLNSGKQSH